MGRGRFKTWYGKTVVSRFACLRVLGVQIAETLAGFGIKRIIITDNGVKSISQSVNKNWIPENGRLQLVFIGTHSPKKGFDQLVNACFILSKKNIAFEVHTMGEWISDKFRQTIFNLLHRNNLTNNFIFHGPTYGYEKWKVLSNSHIFVLPSMIEGQPLVILEAFACGLPVVSTRVGAIPETVEHGKNGFLIASGDFIELAEKLEILLTNRNTLRKMSVENIKLYEKRFTQSAFLQTQVSWLKTCANGNLFSNRNYIYKLHPS
jgi:glycosyltransferase involved in cell wall biosynthesis